MADVTGKLTRGDLNRVFARLLFVQAAIHRRGMQNIGVLFALDAAAARISDPPGTLLGRHADHFNTNPNAVPLVIGGVIMLARGARYTRRASRLAQAIGLDIRPGGLALSLSGEWG